MDQAHLLGLGWEIPISSLDFSPVNSMLCKQSYGCLFFFVQLAPALLSVFLFLAFFSKDSHKNSPDSKILKNRLSS
jgi:hypothetical protein